MPRDTNQLAHKVLQIAIGEDVEPEKPEKDPMAVELGRRGGKIGGKNRWEGVSKKKRTQLAKKAAQARWRKKSKRVTTT